MAVFVADEQHDVPVDADRLSRLTGYVMTDQQVPVTMEVSVLCVDTPWMTELNRTHMGADGPTDVLAFPLDAPGESTAEVSILGDIVVCPAIAAAQASEHERTVASEIDLLVVHGLLHLLGHDHAEAGEKAIMFGLTDRLLAGFPPEAGSVEAGSVDDMGAPR